MLKLHTVTSEGVAISDPMVVEVRNPDTGKPMAGCTITVRTATPKEWKAIQTRHTTYEKNAVTRGMERVQDADAAFDDLLCQKILGWTGILGADDKPLPVLPIVIERLDPRVKAQVFEAILGSEFSDVPPEVRDASFREPA
jgi:hypothetical protein